MRRWMLSLVTVVAMIGPIGAQSGASLQGVWRSVERIVPAAAPAPAGNATTGRRDPFGEFSGGTHTALQPDLAIFTAKHYSRTTDTAAQPRPTAEYKTPGRPTLEELRAEWGPFAANAGTYELSGDTLTLRALVAKNPRAQAAGNITRLRIKLEGNSLWVTPIDTEAGRIGAPVTTKYVRVE